ncbi:MAG TPA: hypothetical protein VH257_16375, partial [Chloroflexota bacterium]|nr:hypothetical protein [Chloroflexota bacterium]
MSAPSPVVAPYGAWPSPITAADVAGAAVRLGHLAVDGPDLYWIEGRPAERGRNVVVRLSPGGETTDVIPSPANARTRVHEYGGADFAVAGGRLVYSEFADQRLYLLDLRRQQGPGGPPPGQPAPGPARRPPPRPLTESTSSPSGPAGLALRPSPGPGPSGPGLRYADALFDTSRNRLLCVREDHRGLAPPGAGALHPQPGQPAPLP